AAAERRVEMCDRMAVLEALCARRAARAAGPVARARLGALHEACENAARARDADAYYYVNEAFHEAIDGATANAFMSEQTRALRRRLKPFRRLQLRVPDRLEASLAEHAAILAAIEARDPAAADEAMRAHVVVQGTRFDDVAPQARAVAGAR
ncbi:MAG: FCD domain-containing protein, partial [Paracoccaceae bacterium]